MAFVKYCCIGFLVAILALLGSVAKTVFLINSNRPMTHWSNNNLQPPGGQPVYGGAPSTPVGAEFDWCNWDRAVCCGTSGSGPRYPQSEAELAAIVTEASKNNGLVRVVGAGHSMSTIVCDPKSDADQKRVTIISLDKMAQLKGIEVKEDEPFGDAQSHAVVTVGAGIRLRALNNMLWNAGWGMRNLGLIDEQSLAGALSTGTHGTGMDVPSLPNAVVGMRLLLANGTTLQLKKNPNQNRDLFSYAVLSLGLLGITTEISIKIQPRYYLQRDHKFKKFSDVFAKLDQSNAQVRNYQFWPIPGTDLVLENSMKKYDGTDAAQVAMSPLQLLLATIKTDALFTIMTAIERMWQDISLVWILPHVEPEISFVARSDAVLNFPGINYHSATFSEVEFFVPYENTQAALTALIEASESPEALAEGCKENSFHPVRFVAPDDLPLSPWRGWKKGGGAFSYVLLQRPNYLSCAKKMDSLMRTYGAKMHWGKRNFMTYEDAKGMYGEDVIEQFRGFVQELDPQGTFAPNSLKEIFNL